MTHYQLTKPADLLAWLAVDAHTENPTVWQLEQQPPCRQGGDIARLLEVELTDEDLCDRRETFEIEADFAMDGSVLIRSGFAEQDRGPDTVHLQTWSRKAQKFQSVLPGTSVAGAIRQRAGRIANTLAGPDQHAEQGVRKFIDEMFGPAEIRSDDQAHASRVRVDEEFISGGRHLVQTRIKIDRFTSSTMESALLEEAPHFGGTVKLCLTLRNPEEAEIGLLLLVLKDLWLSDLPLGGEASVGRGRLRGQSATLRRSRHQPVVLQVGDATGTITIAGSDNNTASWLEACVAALHHTNWVEVK